MGATLSSVWRAVFRPWFWFRTAAPFRHHYALDDNSVRLLRFVRPKWYTLGLARPSLVIETHPVDKSPKYVALSYTWGPPQDGIAGDEFSDKLPVLVNGRPFPVLRNLMDALCCLHWRWDFDDDVQHLWVDAICINQNDLAERAAQVGIMDRIYKRAASTSIWLGRANPEAAKAIKMVKTILLIPPEDFGRYYRQHPNGVPPPDEFWHERGLPSPEKNGEEWKPLINFLEHRWFSRTWVIQEVTLSSSDNVFVFWGPYAMTWDELGRVVFAGRVARLGQLGTLPALSRYLSGDSSDGHGDGKAKGMKDWVVSDSFANSFQLWYNRHRYLQLGNPIPVDDTMRNEMRSLSGCTTDNAVSWLMYFALTNRWADATDPRDKVFGHLGLINNIAEQDGLSPLAVRVNYSADITSAHIYEQTMRHLIDQTDSLAVLMAINDPPYSRQPNLPSWVPDLSRRHGLELMWSIRPQFNAVSTEDEQPDSQPPETNNRRRKIHIAGPRIHVRAAVIGTVSTLSVSLPDLIGPDWHRFAGHLLGLPGGATYPFTGQARVEAFWRTLLMDSVARRCPARWPGSAGDGDMFRGFVLQCLARYFPGATTAPAADDADDGDAGGVLGWLRDVNELAATDFSGHMPSCRGLADLTLQIAGLLDEENGKKEKEEEEGLLEEKEEEEEEEEGGREERMGSPPPHDKIVKALAVCVDRTSTFLIGMDGSMVNRRIVISNQGHLANSPMWTEVGDTIVVLDSCPCPLVLRPHPEDPSCYTMVGSAYVHGAMYGKSIGEDTEWEEVCIR